MTNPTYARDKGDGRGRTYPIPGYPDIEFLSVTNRLGIVSKPALYAWNARLAAECAVGEEGTWHAIQQEQGKQEQGNKAAIDYIKTAPRRLLEEKSSLGTRVHHACEHYGNIETVEKDVLPFLRQYGRFITENQVEFVEQESTVFSPEFEYAGTLDMVVRFRDKTYIGDIKTGSVGYDTQALQLCAYARATHRVVGDTTEPIPYTVDGAFILDLKSGSYRLLFADISNRTWEAFKSVVALHKWQDAYGRKCFGEEFR